MNKDVFSPQGVWPDSQEELPWVAMRETFEALSSLGEPATLKERGWVGGRIQGHPRPAASLPFGQPSCSQEMATLRPHRPWGACRAASVPLGLFSSRAGLGRCAQRACRL